MIETVAIVGNSSGLLGSRLGHRIDAHDLVIRMNLFRIYPFQADVGVRTDIVVLVQNPLTVKAARNAHLPAAVESCQEIWFSRPLGLRNDIDNQTHNIVRWLPFGIPDCRFPDGKAVLQIKKMLTPTMMPDGRRIHALPSTGLITLLMAAGRYPDATFGLAGFGEQEGSVPGEHYFPDRYKGEWVHDDAGEKKIIQEMIDIGRARWIYTM